MRRLWLLPAWMPAVLTAPLLAGGFAACGPAPAPDEPPAVPGAEAPAAGPVRGDWLVLHTLSDPESLNPLTSNDAGASSVLNWIFPSLVSLDPESLELEPVIAREQPEVSEDKLEYTYRLRDDVTFSDGTPLSAEDVLFAIKATLHPKVNAPHARNYFESVRDATVIDPHTIRFELREPYFRNDLTLGSISPLPRHYYDPEGLLEGIRVSDLRDWENLTPETRERAERFAKQFNEDFLRNPMGPGAFVLRDPENDWVTGERLTLHHRDDFWAPGDSHAGDAWVDRVVYRIINDRAAALVAFKGGDLDLLTLTPIQHRRQTDSERFKQRAGKNVGVRGGTIYIGWNQSKPILADRQVRRALSHLVDKQNIIDKVLLGLGRPIEGPIFPKRSEYNQELPPYPFDPKQARALLEEAGWVDTDGDGIRDKVIDGERVPLRIEMLSNTGNDQRRDIGLAVIDEFKRAGIDASFRGIDWSIFLDRVKNFNYDAIILGWTGSGATPPDMYQIWHSSQAVPGGSNFVNFRNGEADRLLEEYRISFDPAKRKRLYDRFQEILYEEQPYTFLYTPETPSTWDRRFQGVLWNEVTGPDLNRWWVPAGRQKHEPSF